MRGGFGGRGARNNGFERPIASSTIDSLEHALYPPSRQFYYFPPNMLQVTTGAPRIPSAALDLCQNAKPLPAAQMLGVSSRVSTSGSAAASPKILFAEGAVSSANTVGTVDDIVSWMDAGSKCAAPKLFVNDDTVLEMLGTQNFRTFNAVHSLLPAELRIYSVVKGALQESEKQTLYRIKQHKRARLEKPTRRGGVVVQVKSDKARPPQKGRSNVSALVDIAAVEEGGRPLKRPRGDGVEGDEQAQGSEHGEAADDGENSVSSMGSMDDDDDAVDDISGGGSGDELTF